MSTVNSSSSKLLKIVLFFLIFFSGICNATCEKSVSAVVELTDGSKYGPTNTFIDLNKVNLVSNSNTNEICFDQLKHLKVKPEINNNLKTGEYLTTVEVEFLDGKKSTCKLMESTKNGASVYIREIDPFTGEVSNEIRTWFRHIDGEITVKTLSFDLEEFYKYKNF